jgi:hypothetical protein
MGYGYYVSALVRVGRPTRRERSDLVLDDDICRLINEVDGGKENFAGMRSKTSAT